MLEGRKAVCPYCKSTVPSSEDLAFFEYRGEGSNFAKGTCKHCRYAETAHRPEVMRLNKALKCTTFEPIVAHEFDSFYCGCRGWD